MKAVPRRLLVIGGGAAGVELARRCAASAARSCSSSATSACSRARPRRSARRSARCCVATASRSSSAPPARGAGATARTTCSSSTTAASCAASRLLVATGRRPRVEGIGLETVGIEPDPHGVPVDAQLRVGERLWAIGDVTGIWPLTHVGKYQGEVVAANILGEPREANYDAVPRVVYTDPQAAAVGATEARFARTAPLAEVAKTATYTHAYAESNGFLTLLSDGERLTGAYALGPEAGEWLQQATLAIRARVPLDVLLDTIQPFPSFSEIYVAALKALARRCAHRHARGRDDGGALAGRPSSCSAGAPASGSRPARLAHAEGAEVILTGRNPERLERAAARSARRAARRSTPPTSERLSEFFTGLPTPVDHVLVTGGGPYYAPLAGPRLRRGPQGHRPAHPGCRSSSPATRSAGCGRAARCCSSAAPAAGACRAAWDSISALTAAMPSSSPPSRSRSPRCA